MATLREAIDWMRQGSWDKAHNVAQQDSSPEGAWMHGLLHVQEGDLQNAEYWYGVAGRKFRSRGTFEEEINALDEQLRKSGR